MAEPSSTTEFAVASSELLDPLQPLREQILATLVMLAQIPAPTGQEEQRVRFLLDRFVEAGVPEVGPDQKGNAAGLLPGETGERTILLVSHLDTIFPKNVLHNVSLEKDRVVGPSVSDNALGAAVIAMVPVCLATLGYRLNSNLALLGSVKALERNNYEGLRFFLDHAQRPIDHGIVVEGIQLGRANYLSVGKIRGDIVCNVRYDRPGDREKNALVVLNDVVNRILSIPLPSQPYTKIRLGRMQGGISYDTEADHAELGFEIVSHSDELIESLHRQLQNTVAELSAQHGVDLRLDCFVHRESGGLSFSHPLVQSTVSVLGDLGIEPDFSRNPSELPEFISHGIPAITLGMTYGAKHHENEPDYVLIAPILKGVAQLLGVILAIDRGACDEH